MRQPVSLDLSPLKNQDEEYLEVEAKTKKIYSQTSLIKGLTFLFHFKLIHLNRYICTHPIPKNMKAAGSDYPHHHAKSEMVKLHLSLSLGAWKGKVGIVSS